MQFGNAIPGVKTPGYFQKVPSGPDCSKEKRIDNHFQIISGELFA
jgi:hypothetical protein